MEIIITTHPSPDTDALFATAVPGYMYPDAMVTAALVFLLILVVLIRFAHQ